MPMPWTFRHPQREWTAFLDDVADVLGSPSANVAYTATEGVFRAFRRRLTVDQAVAFAQCLPSVPRALFVQDWQLEDPVPWAEAATYIAEAKSLRQTHNFASDQVIEAVSFALHRAVGPEYLHKRLQDIGPEAVAFWHVDGYRPEDLAVRFR
ncbi:DUF2267 domain-containing protein [Rhodobacteraceae bacterium N5(2021)]|uniref:DUF2267 domain-containing protein n=1 Tax=Gymnodinialimonas phycosphaerae TaxID=2841589 RepID=A0A975YFM0_9RHOB|nr:DUF2267 domain-containing protein [Gymnodinialimonas phycosphaerae]MBY4894933.1 DUF2267 domain-containing protein [Gymnodinialimonas phycosphaerae]